MTGKPESTHYCCSVDYAVAPLFHLFKSITTEDANELDRRCNSPLRDFPGIPASAGAPSYLFSRNTFSSALQIIKDGFYAIPKADPAPSIKQVMDILNKMLNDFSYKQSVLPNAFHYVQVTECSQALYSVLARYSRCQTPETPGSGPFCAPYHLPQGKGTVQVPSSLYYFLPNTMIEFPFAWWHKCILLQGRTISANDEVCASDLLTSMQCNAHPKKHQHTCTIHLQVVHCTQWRTDTIKAEDMLNRPGVLDDKDIRGILQRIEGGVTSNSVRVAVEKLETALQKAFKDFSSSGFRNSLELQTSKASVGQGMVRVGARSDFNMKCYNQTSLRDKKEDVLRMGDKQNINCLHNMLMWIHNEGKDPQR